MTSPVIVYVIRTTNIVGNTAIPTLLLQVEVVKIVSNNGKIYLKYPLTSIYVYHFHTKFASIIDSSLLS